jgi:hypothetical protein
MSAPTRPETAAWEPEALELPLGGEQPRRIKLPYRQPDEADDQRTGREGLPGSHVIVIDIA